MVVKVLMVGKSSQYNRKRGSEVRHMQYMYHMGLNCLSGASHQNNGGGGEGRDPEIWKRGIAFFQVF